MLILSWVQSTKGLVLAGRGGGAALLHGSVSSSGSEAYFWGSERVACGCMLFSRSVQDTEVASRIDSRLPDMEIIVVIIEIFVIFYIHLSSHFLEFQGRCKHI